VSGRTIWKFPLPLSDSVAIAMPERSRVLSVGVQSGGVRQLQLWADVNPGAAIVIRRFEIRGTGHPLGDVGRFIGTVIDGPFVWHVFEAIS